MRTISALAVILIGNCLVPSLEAKDIIRDKSPDGKFALRITKENEGSGAAIINLKSKEDVVGLEIYQISLRKRIWYGPRIRKESLTLSRIAAAAAPRSIFEKARNSRKYHFPTVTLTVTSPNARISQLKAKMLRPLLAR